MNTLSDTNSAFQTKDTSRLMAIILGVILAFRVSSFAIYVVGALTIYALKQKRVEFSFFALMLLCSLTITNSVFFCNDFQRDFHFYMVIRGLIFFIALVMTARAGFTRSAWFLSPFSWLFAYIGYMMFVSLNGWAPLVSELKAVLFLIYMIAMIQSVSAAAQSDADIRIIRSAMLALACFFILGSMATIPFPNIGRSMQVLKYEEWGISVNASELTSFFNGMTVHSQTLGPLVAMLNALLLSDYLCNFTKKQPLYRVLLAAAPVLIYMTSSRTALFAYLVSILASVFFFMGQRHVARAKKSRILMNVLLGGILTVFLLILSPNKVNQMEAFLRKTEKVEDIDHTALLPESILKSRIGSIENGIYNFSQSPIVGNGFQVSEEMKDMSTSETGWIISAPIEKGVLPVMILEEGGVIGAVLFALFVFNLYVKYNRLRFCCFLSTFTVFIMLSFGEAVFFSMSGLGGISWVICFCALLMDVLRHKRALAECASVTGFRTQRVD